MKNGTQDAEGEVLLHQEKYPFFGNSVDPLINLFFPEVTLSPHLWRETSALFQCCALLPLDSMPRITRACWYLCPHLHKKQQKHWQQSTSLPPFQHHGLVWWVLSKWVFSLIKRILPTVLQNPCNPCPVVTQPIWEWFTGDASEEQGLTEVRMAEDGEFCHSFTGRLSFLFILRTHAFN